MPRISYPHDRAPGRRARERHQLALPVELEQGVGRGVTRDISAGGVYLECRQGLSPGSPIDFTIVLATESSAEPVRLRCQGHVVRVEPHNERVGIAATIESYTLAAQDRDRVARAAPWWFAPAAP